MARAASLPRLPSVDLVLRDPVCARMLEHHGRALVTEGALVSGAEATPLALIQQIDRVYVNFTQSSGERLALQRALAAGKLRQSEASVQVLCADPLDVDGLDDVRAAFGKTVEASVSTPSIVIDAINRVYERQENMSELASDEKLDDDDQVEP